VTFFGSLVAFAKLAEVKGFGDLRFRGQQALDGVLFLVALGLAARVVAHPEATSSYWGLVAVAAALGVLLTIPIGGANMPIVICLLNSYSGLAAAATGFVLANNGLIIAGSLVGASGIVLTRTMCRAMNQSMTDVVFGAAAVASGASADQVYGGKVKATSPEEVAMLLDGARRVVIVPGYGLAVSQAQHAVRDLALLLEARGAEVEYGIHPVAGRMPGHMNVLLAEANIPYEKVREMDDVNPTFAQTDVAIVIGANDVVNPVARESGNPIAGMPILDVDKARTCVVVKRSLSPGFAGIPNPLFAAPNTLMLFGDGKKAILDLVASLKEQ
jgi:NAD(P) transhydrogenase subunit beta